MEVDNLVAAACDRAGCDDFGTDTWREGLEVLVHALNAEANLNDIGVGAMTDQIVGNLVNRLQIEQWYGRHPEIDDEEIVAPLFGLGLPRTGSTALELPPGAGSGPPLPARMGSGPTVPAARDGDGAHRPPHRRRPGRHRLHQ